MYDFIAKISRLTFLGFLPLLFISSTGKDIKLVAPLEEGTHALHIAGYHDQDLAGKISFNVIKQSSYGEVNYNVLKLSFIGDGLTGPYAMELLISKENSSSEIPLGYYKVATVESFLSPFDGIFGAFSSTNLGDKPFFASDGMVRITQFDKSSVVGRLDLEFKDESGNTFTIDGTFNAR